MLSDVADHQKIATKAAISLTVFQTRSEKAWTSSPALFLSIRLLALRKMKTRRQ